MLAFAKSALLRALRSAGYEVMPRAAAPTMASALARIARRIEVGTVVDVGASDGRWTQLVLPLLPKAQYLLIEAQAHAHGAALRAFAARDPRIHVVEAAAGGSQGEVHFDASDPFGGAAHETGSGPNDVVVPMVTVDGEVERRHLPPPYLLKLDTHGFEVPILEGARDVLARASCLVIEAYNFQLADGVLRFHELCSYLEARGFRCADLADPMWRPGDGFLWQMDLVFVRSDRAEFASRAYDGS